MHIVPPDFVMFQNFKQRLLALKGSKKLTNAWLWQYSLLPKSTSSTSTNSPLPAENSTFLWRGYGQKYCSECAKTRHFKWKIL